MDDLKKEELEKTAEKQRVLEERVPPIDLEGLTKGSQNIYTYTYT